LGNSAVKIGIDWRSGGKDTLGCAVEFPILPILCFFGKSDATRWHPWGGPHVLLQPPSLDVKDISVAEALSGFGHLLEKNILSG
ncbi:hypothetical protein COW53_06815, partial [bacterium CG17_big_fil_post_rev_8_21_14_2_50_64_8]